LSGEDRPLGGVSQQRKKLDVWGRPRSEGKKKKNELPQKPTINLDGGWEPF